MAQTNKNKDVLTEIQKGNPWYVDNQFDFQLSSRAMRRVIENRWIIFESSIREYLKERDTIGTKDIIRLLDAGCGDGINLLFLSKIMSKYYLNFELFGVDYNPLRLKRANSISETEGLVQSSICALPFKNNTFDIIVCNQMLEHVGDDVKALLEMQRVLNSTGLLILDVPNEGCILAQLRNKIIEPIISKTTDHVNFYTVKKLKNKINNTELSVKRIIHEGFFMPHERIQIWLATHKWGFKLLDKMGKVFKSQAAGLCFLCKKI